jgi:hypothetical protein
MIGARPTARSDIVVDAGPLADRLRRCVEAVLANAHGDLRLLPVDAVAEDQAPGGLVEDLARRGLRGVEVRPGRPRARAPRWLTMHSSLATLRPRSMADAGRGRWDDVSIASGRRT